MVNILDDEDFHMSEKDKLLSMFQPDNFLAAGLPEKVEDEIPFGHEPESVEKTIGQVRGREIGFGRLSTIVTSDGVTLHVDDDADDEFWLDIHLSRQELADILLQCGEEAR